MHLFLRNILKNCSFRSPKRFRKKIHILHPRVFFRDKIRSFRQSWRLQSRRIVIEESVSRFSYHERMQEGVARRFPESGDIGGTQDGERGCSGTNSSRRIRDNAAHPSSLICIRFVFRGNHHFLHPPSTSSIFNGSLIDQRSRAATQKWGFFRPPFSYRSLL